jgi:hypothetical protein
MATKHYSLELVNCVDESTTNIVQMNNKPKFKNIALKLFNNLENYFSNDLIEKQLIAFINEKKISGRLFDFLVTTYSRKHLCQVGNSDIRTLYDLELQSLNGRFYFDPFNRKTIGYIVRICEDGSTTNVWHTTIAQMNFVRWINVTGVYNFLKENLLLVQRDMSETFRVIRKERKDDELIGIKRKRKLRVNQKSWRASSILVYNEVVTVSLY